MSERYLKGIHEDVWMYLKGKSEQVKIGQFMSGWIQSVHIKDLSIENLTSSSLQYGVVSLPQIVSSSVAL